MSDNLKQKMIIFEDMHPLKKLLFTGFIVIGVMTLTMLLALLLSMFLFNLSFDQVQNLGTLNNSAVFKFLQIIQAFGLFIIPSFIALYLFTPSPKIYLKVNNTPRSGAMLLCAFIMISALPFIEYIAEINKNINLPHALSDIEYWMRSKEDEALRLTNLLLKADNLWGLALNIFIIGILPAIGEEILFRGVIQQQINEWLNNKHLAIWISAILFSALHMQFLGFVPRMLMGAVFGYMLVWSKSLWFPVFAHFTNNSVAVVTLYFYGNDATIGKIENIEGSEIEVVIISVLLMLSALFIFYKMNNKLIKSSS